MQCNRCGKGLALCATTGTVPAVLTHRTRTGSTQSGQTDFTHRCS